MVCAARMPQYSESGAKLKARGTELAASSQALPEHALRFGVAPAGIGVIRRAQRQCPMRSCTTRRDVEKFCDPREHCVTWAITDELKTLRSANEFPQERADALRFLIHFVGDLHQPLHSSDDHDRGGNSVQVRFLGHTTNLHSLWDSGLLSRLPPEDVLFTELSRGSARHRKAWSKGTVTDWSEQAAEEEFGDGDTAERYGYVNRALPDAELDAFVDTLARRISSFDKRSIAAAKRLVNEISLPPSDRFLDAFNSFGSALSWPETQTKVGELLKRGLQTNTEFEKRWPEVLDTL